MVENFKGNRYSTPTIKLIKEIIVCQSWHEVSVIRPLSENVLPLLRSILRVSIFALAFNFSIYSSSIISKRDAIATEKQLPNSISRC